MCWAEIKWPWLEGQLEQHPLLPLHLVCLLCRAGAAVCCAVAVWALVTGQHFHLQLGSDPPLGFSRELVGLLGGGAYSEELAKEVGSGNGSLPWAAWGNETLSEEQRTRLVWQKAATVALGGVLAYATALTAHSFVAGLLNKLRWELMGLVSPLLALYVLWPVAGLELYFASCLWVGTKEGQLPDARTGECWAGGWATVGWLSVAAGALLMVEGLVWTAAVMESYWEYMYLTPSEYRQYMALQVPADEQGHDFRADYVERRDINGEIVAELWTNTRRKVAPKASCLSPKSFPFLVWRLAVLGLLNAATVLVGYGGGWCQHVEGFGWLHWLKCDLANEFAGDTGGLPFWSWLGFVRVGEKGLVWQLLAFSFLVVSTAAYLALVVFAACECCKIRLCTRMAPPMTAALALTVAFVGTVEGVMGSGVWLDRGSIHWRQPFFDVMAGVAPIIPEDFPETWAFSFTWLIACALLAIATPLVLIDFGVSWLVWRDWRLLRDYADERQADEDLQNKAEGKGEAVGKLTNPDAPADDDGAKTPDQDLPDDPVPPAPTNPHDPALSTNPHDPALATNNPA